MTLLRLLLILLPPRLRRRYGDAILDTYRREAERRRRAHSLCSAGGFLLATIVDLIVTAIRERWSDLRLSRLPALTATRGRSRLAKLDWGIWRDTREAARSLRKTPGFFVVAVTLVALGIGANTAVFTALRALLLSPPPYPGADRLVMLDLTEAPSAAAESTDESGAPRPMLWSYAKYRLFEESPERPVERAAAFAGRWALLADGGDPIRLRVELVSSDFFAVLGLTPALGRAFSPDEDDPSAPPMAAILSDRLWRLRFGEDPNVVGRAIDINDRRVQIVGVAAPGFHGLTGNVDLWVPIASAEPLYNRFMVQSPQTHWLQVIARLGDDDSLDRARASMNLVGQRIAEVYPTSDPAVTWSASARTLAAARENPTARTAVLALTGAALMVLLITCANLAGLLLARAPSRMREIAVRKALGAGRLRLVRRLLVESLVIAVTGGALGLALARLGVAVLASHWPRTLAASAVANLQVVNTESLGLDTGMLLAGGGLAVTTGVVFGLAPAFSLARRETAAALRSGSSRSLGADHRSGSHRRSLGRTSLVACEIALALVLLIGAGLMIGSLERLTAVEYGYDATDLMVFSVALPRGGAAAANPLAFREALLEEVGSLPSVESVAAACTMPLRGHCSTTGVREVEGRPPFPEGSRPVIGLETVSDDYFSTLGVPILSGRTFTTADRDASEPAVILNRTAARSLFPDVEPVGRFLRLGYFSKAEGRVRVIGVVGDVLYGHPQQGVMAEAYVSFRRDGSAHSVVVRTSGDPGALLSAIRERIHELGPRAVIYGETTAREIEARATADTRTVTALLMVFACLAVGLAAAGIWGVVAYSVSDRRQELGLRFALGARRAEITALVLSQGTRAALLGLLFGLPAALAFTRLLSRLLFGLEPWDIETYVQSVVALLLVTIAAGWLPARRASRIDPIAALRAE